MHSILRKVCFLSKFRLSFRASVFQPEHAVRDKRRNDKPYRRKRDERVRDDRTRRSRPGKDRGHEIEIEKSEQCPVHRAEND